MLPADTSVAEVLLITAVWVTLLAVKAVVVEWAIVAPWLANERCGVSGLE